MTEINYAEAYTDIVYDFIKAIQPNKVEVGLANSDFIYNVSTYRVFSGTVVHTLMYCPDKECLRCVKSICPPGKHRSHVSDNLFSIQALLSVDSPYQLIINELNNG